jgi:hypothetical protein
MRHVDVECAVLRRLAVSCALVLFVLGCRRASHAPAPPLPPPPAPALVLPEALAGFAAVTASVTGPGWVRRSYRRGEVQVDVTLARTNLGPGSFDAWLATSRSFPQAALDAPGTDANGFYQCNQLPAPVELPPPSCDLLIQLRSGVHVELRGNGTSSRADVDALAGALPLRALAAPPPTAAGAP